MDWKVYSVTPTPEVYDLILRLDPVTLSTILGSFVLFGRSLPLHPRPSGVFLDYPDPYKIDSVY